MGKKKEFVIDKISVLQHWLTKFTNPLEWVSPKKKTVIITKNKSSGKFIYIGRSRKNSLLKVCFLVSSRKNISPKIINDENKIKNAVGKNAPREQV